MFAQVTKEIGKRAQGDKVLVARAQRPAGCLVAVEKSGHSVPP